MTAAPPTTPLFDAEDFSAYQGTRQSSNIFNRRRQEVNQKLEELGRRIASLPAGAELARVGLERGLSDPHPSLRNQHRVTAQWLYFLRAESERALLEAHLGRVQSLATLVGDPSPMHQHLALTLRVDGAGLSAQLELYSSATVDRGNWLAGIAAPGGEAALAGLLSELAARGLKLVAADVPLPLEATALREALVAEPPALLQIGLPIQGSDDPTLAVAGALQALCPLYQFAAWSEHNDRLGLRAAISEARDAARALAERVGVEEQERARVRREQQESARQRALREGPAKSVLEPRRREQQAAARRERASEAGAAASGHAAYGANDAASGASASPGGTPASSGGAPAAPGGALAASGGTPASSGGAVASSGGTPASSGGSVASSGGAAAASSGAAAASSGAAGAAGGAAARAPGTERPSRDDSRRGPRDDSRRGARDDSRRGPRNDRGGPARPSDPRGGPDRGRRGDAPGGIGRDAPGPAGDPARGDGRPGSGRPSVGPASDGRPAGGRPNDGRRDERPGPRAADAGATHERGDDRPASDRRGRAAGDRGAPRRQLPDASAPVVPVSAGDEVVIVSGLFKGKVATVLATAVDGAVELTVGRLRMTLPPVDLRKIV